MRALEVLRKRLHTAASWRVRGLLFCQSHSDSPQVYGDECKNTWADISSSSRLPWIRSCLSVAHVTLSVSYFGLVKSGVHTIASPSTVKNGSPRAYGSVPSKKLKRRGDSIVIKDSHGKMADEEEGEETEEGWSEEITAEDFNDELLKDMDSGDEDDYWEEEEVDAQIGDGGDGGGVVLGGTSWGAKALAIAEEVLLPFKDELQIFAFKVTDRGYVYVRLEKLSDKYGCPSMDDLETFNSIYAKRLEEVGQDGDVPDNLGILVSSPGAERLIRVPEDLERFKDLPMHVSYVEETTEAKLGSQEKNGIFHLDSVDMESGSCLWKLANVRLNRGASGKGRALNRKQRDWRLCLPFNSLRLIRLYLEG